MHLPVKSLKSIGGLSFKSFFSLFEPYKNIKIILMYHRVVNKYIKYYHDPALIVTSDTFNMHIEEISQHFDIVSLEDIVDSKKNGERLCAITFDDGWADNYDYAFPVLRNRHVSATIFIPVQYIGTKKRFWFQSIWDVSAQAIEHGIQRDFIQHFNTIVPAWKPDYDYIDEEQIDNLVFQLKCLPADELDELADSVYILFGLKPAKDGYILNWEQIRDMGKYNITFGSHGLNHYILPALSYEIKRKEIFDSFKRLNEAGISVSPFFSFPNGDWDNESLALIKEAGYKGTLTTNPGFNSSRSNPFLLNRIAIHDEVSNTPSLLWFRIFQTINPLHRP